MKFPVDAPKEKVLRALQALRFEIVREREHISMARQNPYGSRYAADHAEPFYSESFDPAHHLLTIRDLAGQISWRPTEEPSL